MFWKISIVTLVFLSGSFALDCKKEFASDDTQYNIENCDIIGLNLNDAQFSKVEIFNAGGKNNSFKKLENNGFKEFKELTFLYLSNCKIHEVAEGAFNESSKLSLLNLANNRIKNLHRNTFKPLIYLQNLYLSSNKLVKLDPDLFRKNLKIQTLHLSGNKIERIPSELFKPLSKLNELDLSNNQIYSIGREAFSKLNLTVELNLLNNICISKLFGPNLLSNFNIVNGYLDPCFKNYQRNISLIFNGDEICTDSSSSGFVILFFVLIALSIFSAAIAKLFMIGVLLNE
jgi:hypothetical protein